MIFSMAKVNSQTVKEYTMVILKMGYSMGMESTAGKMDPFIEATLKEVKEMGKANTLTPKMQALREESGKMEY